MNDYWSGLLEYSRKRDKKEEMKNTIKTVGCVVIDVILAFVVINMIGYAVLCLFAYSAHADEVLTPSERVVARTLLGEARGEHTTGIYAVGCVIQKRAANRNLTPAQVCQEPWQISIWNAGKGKIKKESELWHLYERAPVKVMRYARQLARDICANRKLSQDYTGNADHYYSHKIMKQPPSWAFKIDKKTGKFLRDKKGNKIPVQPTKVIGNHSFYKLR